MLPYTNRARTADAKEQYELGRSCTYDLMSVVVHVGEIDTGHYISYCRVGEQVKAFSFDLLGKDRQYANMMAVVHFQRPSGGTGIQIGCARCQSLPLVLHRKDPAVEEARPVMSTQREQQQHIPTVMHIFHPVCGVLPFSWTIAFFFFFCEGIHGSSCIRRIPTTVCQVEKTASAWASRYIIFTSCFDSCKLCLFFRGPRQKNSKNRGRCSGQHLSVQKGVSGKGQGG